MIPVNEPLLGERELELTAECIRTGWISSAGAYLEAFESGWAEYCGRRYGVACSNGTAALQMAVRALGIGPGDEVIMPTFTIISCALAVIDAGATPVLVDCDPRTWCMDVGQVASRVNSRTRAIMPVHIYGHPVEMEPLVKLAERHGLHLIEDAAEAHGALCRIGEDWRRCGSFGAVSCFSFYANKLITTGEGGMVLTDDPDVAERLRSLRNLAFQRGRRFLHESLGYNYRMTNLQAALGVAQLERFDEIVRKKRWIGARYNAELSNLPALQLPAEESWARSVYWMYGAVLRDDWEGDATLLADRLREREVETRPFFMGMHEQPVFRDMGLFKDEGYPVAERIARRGLYLPSGLTLSQGQLEHVALSIREVLA